MKLGWMLKDWIEEEEKTGTQIKETSPGWVGGGRECVEARGGGLAGASGGLLVVQAQVGSPSGTLGRGLGRLRCPGCMAGK